MADTEAPGFRPPNASDHVEEAGNVAPQASQNGVCNGENYIDGVGSGTSGGGGDEEEKKGKRKKREKKKEKNKNKKFYYKYMVPRIGCLKLKVEEDEEGNVDMQVVGDGTSDKEDPPHPTHLIVTVNGIIGSADNWKFAAKQFLRKYPRDVIVHCSKSNYGRLTFHGIDVMGDRLEKEVLSVIQRHPSVKKISFIGHSLGGLIARYTIAKLYECDPIAEASQGNGHCNGDVPDAVANSEEKTKGKIAGLEPINFITFATPHLGSRGHKQVPLLYGSYTLENVATRLSWVLGRSGKHLFLTDQEKGKTPLLLQMVHDTEDLKFISALQSFKRRVAYSNVHFDKLVGWSTSSIRHRHELPRMRNFTRDPKYRHIVYAKTLENALPQQEAPPEANDNGHIIDYEEEMIKELTRMSWERFNVKFNGNNQRLLAHGTIQVQNSCLYSKGVDVVEHMVDTFVL